LDEIDGRAASSQTASLLQTRTSRCWRSSASTRQGAFGSADCPRPMVRQIAGYRWTWAACGIRRAGWRPPGTPRLPSL